MTAQAKTTAAPCSYEEAFLDICALLDVPAMPIAPREAYQTVIRPRIVALLRKRHD